MAASQGRRRSMAKPNTEDHALNQIASEAEARLAAKRTARAEARSIRMKELERMQHEADEKMDREYQRSLLTDDAVKQRTARVADKFQARIAAAVSEGEVNGPVSQEIQIKSLQENLREMSERFKKAMVSNAQLDNEKQALSYQVDCLKDRLEDSEERIENLKQEITDKSRECNRLSRENKNNIEELGKMREQLILRDKLLEEHGIPTDGSEQPDISQLDLSTCRINESLHLDSIELEQSVLNKSRGSSRRSSIPDDRESLLEQIKMLKEKVSDLRREPELDDVRLRDVENLQRDLNKQSTELKVRIQKLETENARLEGNTLRLETQAKRYKSQAEAAESVEDTLLADKRRLARELRNAQEHIMELETEKDHLQKRVEKYKQRRKEEF